MNHREHHKRSLVKAISYRFFAVLVTAGVTFLVTKRVDVSVSIASMSLFTNTVCYYLHERLWSIIHWGKDATDEKKVKSTFVSATLQ